MNKILLLAFGLYSVIAISQNIPDNNIRDWENEQVLNNFLTRNLSPVFYIDSCSYVGIFGKNNQKINIHFDNVTKQSDEKYNVLGSSLLKDKKCEFSGNLNIKTVQLYFINGNCDVKNFEVALIATGSYRLEENDSTQGIFEGSFKKYFVYNLITEKIYCNSGIIGEVGTTEGYAGYWYSKNDTTKMYSCHFGFTKYPQSLSDFDVNGGESIINPKYKQYGWESYFINDNYGTYQDIECDSIWWK